MEVSIHAIRVQPRQRLDAGTLYRNHLPFVSRFLTQLGVPEQDIADLVQEVFLVAHTRGGFLPDRAQPTTWLAEIAVRVVSDQRKKRRRRHEDSDAARVRLASAPGAVVEQLAAREALRRVQQAVDALAPAKGDTFVLFQIEGRSCHEIAQCFQIPVGTIHSRVHYARREFLAVYDGLVSSPSIVPAQCAGACEASSRQDGQAEPGWLPF